MGCVSCSTRETKIFILPATNENGNENNPPGYIAVQPGHPQLTPGLLQLAEDLDNKWR
ncbi:hypothetical protein Bhyg_13681 [Pseudolycoriella hygida]|uniref:Uncharacterized protein n=1 Tax=Pseudolycoriella hygida TaxID=35572 RepID=A0A9Q0RWQ0_9DIPT|nr:hypothetical protein Bhyg_13681 [Pseudolycoriella hygida]